MKGHTSKDGKFHPHSEYKKGIRKSRDQTVKQEGVKIRNKRYAKEVEEFPLDKVLEKTEKDIAQGLKEHDFTNPKLRNKEWEVGITYEGGFQEEYFSFWAQPKDESIKPVTVRSFVSNAEWSSGMDDEDAYNKKLEKDPVFAEKEYANWLAETFEAYNDHWFMDLADTIDDENP